MTVERYHSTQYQAIVENVINRYRTSAFWRRDERNQCLGVRRVDTLGPQAYALNVNVRYWLKADIR